ncbi:serine hydrolase [Frondihabitans sucicola]|uniref:Serine hydrolase n=1 Tax=Frondihabitans sucicola TaxID=1268041 RepID=A0ABN6XV15_9MICO|nr:serine hydrolase domain-containing protein [Frondihabitans sucicola]BDZ48867.1 serine hydrolase [Frondihabitans sucicola]
MFTSVVILQLVQEGKVSLDQPVDRYLPGLLRGTGIDGRKITVRQLLQHKSGLPNYTLTFGTDLFAIRNTYLSPRDLIDRALSMPADFAPGSRFEYSNTNYAVAGLLADRVTGRPIGELISDRIIDRLHLKHTTFPAPGDSRIHGPHARGYNNTTTGKLEDITVSDPSWAWAAGEIVASPSDLNRFMKALLGGRLLDPAELTQMKTTVPYDDVWANAGYGLGLARYPLSCGRAIWGHGGDIPGYETRNGVDASGKAVTIAVTALPQALATGEAKIVRIAHDVETTLDTAFCG